MKQKSPCGQKIGDFYCKLSPGEIQKKVHASPSHGLYPIPAIQFEVINA